MKPLLRHTGAMAGIALVAALGLALVFTLVMSGRDLDPTNLQVTLADIETTVANRFAVPEVTDVELVSKIDRPDVVLFDVREADEFEQSHLPGARRIDPGTSAKEFMAAFGAELKDRTVVFYCAVGVRSGMMLARVQAALPASGTKAAYNLRGGIFRWHADRHAVVTQSGPVDTVHPYDDAWRQLLDRTLQSRSTLQ